MELAAAVFGLSAAHEVASAPRAVSLYDVLEAASIDSLSVAPSGKSVAFRVLSPSIKANRTSARWYIVNLKHAPMVQSVGRNQAPRWLPFFDSPINESIAWSADERSLLMLEDTSVGVQVHRVGRSGSDITITHDAADVERFELAGGGELIWYWTRNPRSEIRGRDQRNAQIGLHFDRTIVTDGLPLMRNYPTGTGWVSLRQDDDHEYRAGQSGPLVKKFVTDQDHAPEGRFVSPTFQTMSFVAGETPASSLSLADGWSAKLVRSNGPDQAPDDPANRVQARRASEVQDCLAAFCRGTSAEIKLVSADMRSPELVVLFEKDGSGEPGLYAWTPSTNATRTIREPSGALSGGSKTDAASCVRSSEKLVCVASAPAMGPRLVSIDLRSGATSTLFDPNVNLAKRAFPRTSLLSWTDEAGRRATGVLVEPAVRRYPVPLVLTTYHCRGLLRGGTSNLAPEFMIAQRGMVALCVNLNPSNLNAPPETPGDNVLKLHKAAMASYLAAIRLLAGQGIADFRRVAITGHSFSSNAIAYTISHSTAFRAAVMGDGVSIDPSTYFVTAPAADSWRRYDVLGLENLPHPTDDAQRVWAVTSPSLNANKIKTALLIQSPENEYLDGMQLYSAIEDAGGTVDMFVYPGAGHMMERFPLQEYWRARRSIDWLSFWLQGTGPQSADEGTLETFAYWRHLRANRSDLRDQ